MALGFVIEVGHAVASKDAELAGSTVVRLDGLWLLGTVSLGFSL